MLGKIMLVLMVVLGWYAFRYFATFFSYEPNLITYLVGVTVGLAGSWFLEVKAEWS